jgi:lipoprotein-anchoring transpeptidase ErfK/SrfK
VEWKNRDHVSGESGAPMPYAVFFAPGGIAFHEGSLQTNSAGCVRLAHREAVAFFDYLQVGDEVQVHSDVPAAA